jgi:hypothetical protein
MAVGRGQSGGRQSAFPQSCCFAAETDRVDGEGRGVCPACNTRRKGETAAHLADRVFSQIPVRHWVPSVPKWLRYHLERQP